MSEVAIHLTDNVIPDVPVRQYVLSLPIALRYWCASNPKLLNAVHRIARDAVAEYVMAKSDRDDGEPGILTFVQRFGSALNLNIHFHMIVVEGVFVEKSTGRVKFYDILSPTDGEICDLVTHISNKMIKLLRKRGYLDEEGLASADLPEDKLLEDNPVQAHAMAASVQLKIGLGPNAGKSVRRIDRKSVV